MAEENNNNKSNDNSRYTKAALICILFAVIFIIFTFAKLNGEKKNLKKEKEIQTEIAAAQEESKNYTDAAPDTETENEDSITDAEYQKRVEQATEFIPDENEQEYPMYQDGFELRNFNEELLPYVNNDKDGMIADMQKTLYENGYYDYQYADFDGTVEVDYNKNTISFDFTVQANQPVSVTEVYLRSSNTWLTRIW